MTSAKAVWAAKGTVHPNQAMRIMAIWDARKKDRPPNDVFTGSAVSTVTDPDRPYEEKQRARYAYYFRPEDLPRPNPSIRCRFIGIEDRGAGTRGRVSPAVRDLIHREQHAQPEDWPAEGTELTPDPDDPDGDVHSGRLTVKIGVRACTVTAASTAIIPVTVCLYVMKDMLPLPGDRGGAETGVPGRMRV